MASLLRKAKHIGKARVKFQFDVQVHEIRGLPERVVGPVNVVWTRGPRVAATTFSAAEANGAANWEEKLSMVVTLFRKSASVFQDKAAKFTIKEETKKKSSRTVGYVAVNLNEYATADGAPIMKEFTLHGTGKKDGAPPVLRLTFRAIWLKDYTGGDDDTASMMTDISRLSLGGEVSEMSNPSSHNIDEDLGPDLDDELGLGSPARTGRTPSVGGGTAGGGAGGSSSSVAAIPIAVAAAGGVAVGAGAGAAAAGASSSSGGGGGGGSSSNTMLEAKQREVEELKSELIQVTAAKEELAIKARHEREQLLTRLRGLEEARGLLEDENKTIHRQHDDEMRDMQNELDSMLTKMKRVEGERDHLQARVMLEEEENVKVQQELNDMRRKVSVSIDEGSTPAADTAAAANEQVEEMLAQITDLQEKNRTALNELRDVQKQNHELQADLAQERAEKDTVLEDRKQLRIQVSKMTTAAATTRTGAAAIGSPAASSSSAQFPASSPGSAATEEQLVQSRMASSQLQSEVVELQAQVDELEAACEAQGQELAERTAQLIEAKMALAEAAGDKFALEKQCKQLKAQVFKAQQVSGALGKKVAKLEVRYENEKRR